MNQDFLGAVKYWASSQGDVRMKGGLFESQARNLTQPSSLLKVLGKLIIIIIIIITTTTTTTIIVMNIVGIGR